MPHLTRPQVEAAMAYYIHEPKWVAEDMRSNAAVLHELMSHP
jgi:hypothetical protein